jgi:hypothetical protein
MERAAFDLGRHIRTRKHERSNVLHGRSVAHLED